MKYTYQIERDSGMKMSRIGLGTPASLVTVLYHWAIKVNIYGPSSPKNNSPLLTNYFWHNKHKFILSGLKCLINDNHSTKCNIILFQLVSHSNDHDSLRIGKKSVSVHGTNECDTFFFLSVLYYMQYIHVRSRANNPSSDRFPVQSEWDRSVLARSHLEYNLIPTGIPLELPWIFKDWEKVSLLWNQSELTWPKLPHPKQT